VEAFHEEIQRLRSNRPTPAAHGRLHKRESGRSANREQLPLLPAEDPAPTKRGPGGNK
jgi:hypothetical protein